MFTGIALHFFILVASKCVFLVLVLVLIIILKVTRYNTFFVYMKSIFVRTKRSKVYEKIQLMGMQDVSV